MKKKTESIKERVDEAAYKVKAGYTKGRDVVDEKQRDAKRKVQEITDGGLSAWNKIRAAAAHGVHIARKTVRWFRRRGDAPH